MAKKLIQVVYQVDNKQLKDTSKEIRKLEQDTKDSEKGFQKIGSTGKAAFASIGGAIAALGLISLGKQIVQITSEFQKFQAVLTNTLGNRSAANAAMKQIQTFAAQTPFSVQELTAAFVKLANQGFKPTQNEMRKLGDLAAAMGKSFDQLTEAIIDAQTGEFERLKEFGIRASKEGDKVTFTFKEVKTQVDFTASSIRDYILTLGDLEGVTGGMAAISETLGGRISNLGDAWDAVMIRIGQANSGVLYNAVELLTKLAHLLAPDEITEEQAVSRIEAIRKEYADLEAELIKTTGILDGFKRGRILDRQQELKDEEQTLTGIYNRLFLERQEVESWEAKQKAIKDTSKEAKVLTKDTDKLTEAQKKQLDAINSRGKGKDPNNLMGDWYKSLQESVNKQIKEVTDKGPSPLVGVVTGGKDATEISDELDFLLDMSLGFLDDLFQASLHSREEIFKAEEFDLDRRLLLAGDNERARQEIMLEKEEFDKEQAKKKEAFDRAQDKKEKERVIKKMTLDAFVMASKAALVPPVPNFVRAATALAFGLANVGLAKAVGFKDGVIDLQGPGTSTSDSISARLSKGESVMTADETARSYNLLTAIREKKIDDRILERAGTGQMIVASLNDQGIIKAIRENRGPSFSREGYTLMETHKIGSNLKRKVRAKII